MTPAEFVDLVRLFGPQAAIDGITLGEATNRVSQHILREQGFVERARRTYRDYRYRDESVFASIKGHAEAILMDKGLV